MLELTEIMDAIAAMQTFAPIIMVDSGKLYNFVKTMVKVAEDAYGTASGTGASKLAMVLAAVEAFATYLGANFADIKSLIVSLISTAKGAANAVAAVVPAPAVAA